MAGADLTQPWEYLTAESAWSARETDSDRISTGAGADILVSNEMSVARHGEVYVLVSQGLAGSCLIRSVVRPEGGARGVWCVRMRGGGASS